MNQPMSVLIGYDGSPCAEAALLDLRRAGLPQTVEAVVMCVADVLLPPQTPPGPDTEQSPFPASMPEAAMRASEPLQTYFPTRKEVYECSYRRALCGLTGPYDERGGPLCRLCRCGQ